MIDDVYIEDFVKRKKGTADLLFRICIIFATTLLILFLNIVPIIFGYNIIYFTGLISFGIGWLCYIIIRNTNIEYEISLTNDNFAVTRIIAQKKRELLYDFSVKECDYIAPVTCDRYKDDRAKSSFALNLTGDKNVDIDADTSIYSSDKGGSKWMTK